MPEPRILSWQDIAVGNPLSYGTLPEDLTQATDAPLIAAPLIDDLRRTRFRAAPADDDQRDSARQPQYVNPGAAGSKRIAVLVSHGMGQQVPFETLHAVAEGLWGMHVDRNMRVDDLRVRYVTFGRSWRPRVELTLSDAAPASDEQAATTREVHLYEAYWAPLTEGEARLRDVFTFLLDAAKRGVQYGTKGYGRYMFGQYQTCALTRTGTLFLHLTRVVLWLTAIGFIGFWIAAATQALAAAHMMEWRHWTAPLTWTIPLGAGLVFLIVGLSAVGASLVIGASSPSLRAPSMSGKRWRARLSGIVMLGAAVAMVAALVRGWHVPWLELQGWRLAAALIVIALIALVLNRAREIVVEVVGDVAIYVSSHTVSRFARVREAIQSVGRSLARDVYGAYDLKEKTLVYDEVVVVGHSLGSVVAYDMLNDSIQRDLELANRVKKWSDVIGRTKLLLTAGSPLDKTAFLFRTQADALATREALAAATQPMIRDYGLRPANWVNIWSPWDWISGSLQYYDDLGQKPLDARAVINKLDADAPLFVASAHTGYWHRATMRTQLYDAIWS